MLEPVSFGQYDPVPVVKRQDCWGPTLSPEEGFTAAAPLEGAIPVNYCQNQENNEEIIFHV